MKNLFAKTGLVLVLFCLLLPVNAVLARDNITDWYIKDFNSDIVLNKDSSILVTEMITADCGNLPGKHGIFRVLPTQVKTPSKIYPTPLKLVSITDFSGHPLKYEELDNPFDHTVTWKIGDPAVTVHGENYYKITYSYKNTVRFDDPGFDEFYWNLNGNFWDIETDNFSGRVTFPSGVNKGNTDISYYTGLLKSKDTSLAKSEWESDNVLRFDSLRILRRGEGITVSVSFPKNLLEPAKLSFFDLYGWMLGYAVWLLIPLTAFTVCFVYWLKYGRDVGYNKTQMPEFTVPENLSPMVSGMLVTGGKWNSKFIAAGIVSLATKGTIKITDLKKGVFSAKDYSLELTGSDSAVNSLDKAEKALCDGLFGTGKNVKISELSRSFSSKREKVKKAILGLLVETGMLTKKGLQMQNAFNIIGMLMVFGGMFIPGLIAGVLKNVVPDAMIFLMIFNIAGSGAIFLFFGLFMNQRTPKGNEANWHLGNLQTYMKTAEKGRQEFYEKENIFEKFLPYAMVFGIVDLWVKKMKEIYGPDYYNSYSPVWYSGGRVDKFSAESFSSALTSLSSSIASNIGTSSGSHGGGGSGGGGGGGGGGGW